MAGNSAIPMKHLPLLKKKGLSRMRNVEGESRNLEVGSWNAEVGMRNVEIGKPKIGLPASVFCHSTSIIRLRVTGCELQEKYILTFCDQVYRNTR